MTATRKIIKRLEELRDQLPQDATIESLIDKAAEAEKEEGPNMDRSRRIQPGARVDPDLWMEFRKLALNMNRSASDLVEEAMRDYLERIKKEDENERV